MTHTARSLRFIVLDQLLIRIPLLSPLVKLAVVLTPLYRRETTNFRSLRLRPLVLT